MLAHRHVGNGRPRQRGFRWTFSYCASQAPISFGLPTTSIRIRLYPEVERLLAEATKRPCSQLRPNVARRALRAGGRNTDRSPTHKTHLALGTHRARRELDLRGLDAASCSARVSIVICGARSGAWSKVSAGALRCADGRNRRSVTAGACLRDGREPTRCGTIPPSCTLPSSFPDEAILIKTMIGSACGALSPHSRL